MASTTSSCTFTFVRINAANCTGKRPMRVGCTPLWSTRHGTSTAQPSGRLSISRSLSTLPLMTRGWPVTMEWMIALPYSTLRVIWRRPSIIWPAPSISRGMTWMFAARNWASSAALSCEPGVCSSRSM